ncbi:MAG: hypothetical protein IJQ24_11585 [Synergistaceae bacterium]|nr:hypothetical protein [Synergistaceae bacterium]
MEDIKRYFHHKYAHTRFESKLDQLDRWLDRNEQQILESYNPAEAISDYAKGLLLPITEDNTSEMNDINTRMEGKMKKH